jgi:hypothetical protein
MATVQSSNRLALEAQLAGAAVEQAPAAPDPSALPTLSSAGLRLLGAVLLLLGILMMSTFVLLPAGVPLALLAVTLIAAPGDF